MSQTQFVKSRCQPGHIPPSALGRLLPALVGPGAFVPWLVSITHTSLPSSRGLLSESVSASPPFSCEDASHGYLNCICNDPISQNLTFCTLGWTWIWECYSTHCLQEGRNVLCKLWFTELRRKKDLFLNLRQKAGLAAVELTAQPQAACSPRLT